MNDVVAAFNEYFEVIDARSPELLRHAFHLRYRVLCIEQRLPGFDASQYVEERERDSYDDHSAHILLRHRPSNEFVGTARLILPDPLNPKKLFPIERHTQFDPVFVNASGLSRLHTGEISRLVVVRRFSRRRDEPLDVIRSGKELEKWGPTKQRRFPHPMLALAVGIIRMSVENNITHWFSVMDPSLNRLLEPYGLHLDPIGPLTNYHGPRRPYYVNLIKMLDRMYKNHNQFWELVTDYGRVRPMSRQHAADSASSPPLSASAER